MTNLRLCLIFALVPAGAAAADPILSNLPGNVRTSVTTSLGLGVDGNHRSKAVGLTMGAQSLDFVSMVVHLGNGDDFANSVFGGIYGDDGGNPGALLAAFDSASVPAGAVAEQFTLTISDGFTLQAGVSYWFLLDGPDVLNNLYWPDLIPATPPTAFGDVTYDGYRFSADNMNNWVNSSIFNTVQINAVPAPAGAAVFALAAFAVARRRR